MPVDLGNIYEAAVDSIETVFKFLYHYFDVYYFSWLAWIFYPLVVTLILPLTILLLIYASALFLHLYRLRQPLKQAVKDAVHRRDFWDGARRILAALWDAQGRIWHGEICRARTSANSRFCQSSNFGNWNISFQVTKSLDSKGFLRLGLLS